MVLGFIRVQHKNYPANILQKNAIEMGKAYQKIIANEYFDAKKSLDNEDVILEPKNSGSLNIVGEILINGEEPNSGIENCAKLDEENTFEASQKVESNAGSTTISGGQYSPGVTLHTTTHGDLTIEANQFGKKDKDATEWKIYEYPAQSGTLVVDADITAQFSGLIFKPNGETGISISLDGGTSWKNISFDAE